MTPEHKALIKTKEHQEFMELFEKYHGGDFGTAFTAFARAMLELNDKRYQAKGKKKDKEES